MEWIHRYQLFLFDFDGILVNTEKLHYLAYKMMCQERGVILGWDFDTYCRHAMFRHDGVKEAVYKEYPELYRQEPEWDVLYQEKKQAYLKLLHEMGVSLMPGVSELLEALQEAGIKRCVVTHSPKEQIALIRNQNPILNSIPNWLTREDYEKPKPFPECYLKAIEMFGEKEDCMIGFEDSPRGLKALLGTKAEAILISPFFKKEEVLKEGNQKFEIYSSFSELCTSLG